jgi:hypothetical protein
MKAEMKERTLEWVCIVILAVAAIGSIYLWSSEHDKSTVLKNDKYSYKIDLFQAKKQIKELKEQGVKTSAKLEESENNVKRLEQSNADKTKQLAEKNAKIAALKKVKVKKK